MIEIGFHTDAFNSSYWNFEKCLQWAQANDVHYIECGTIDGVSWLHGLGYQPHVALHEDPIALRKKMDGYGVKFSQLDAAYPISLPDAPSLGTQYIINTIRWGYLAGCTHIDTTDHMYKPEGQTHEEALEMMKRVYGEVLDVAVHYDMIINIEPHGYYTTKPDFMAQMLDFFDTPLLRMNMDTGNTFIAGQDPVAFCNRFKDRISHVHVKDVSETLAASLRGELTGIAVSNTAIGDGVNVDNIKACFDILVDINYDGVVSIECEGQGGPMIEKSLAWVRELVDDANRRMDA
ncbi:MAG: sugar phosphate isomerase/epimerase [Anaerolineae bacterium]|nr:sugar phosphate isomerase/epimerase [Anaerolineae bacterium]MCO5198254.1 sugar phosphate isomerase/epimerase [Anaerolineae bacterium]MCO5207094.1 sugar phosphate isomerase/epimerase [Anaerolineae bacterium]